MLDVGPKSHRNAIALSPNPRKAPKPPQAFAMRSLGRPFAIRQLKDWFEEDLDYQTVRETRKRLLEEQLDRDGITLKPGAKELLQALKEKGIVTAVATATDMERIQKD